MKFFKYLLIIAIALGYSKNSWAQTVPISTSTPTDTAAYEVPRLKTWTDAEKKDRNNLPPSEAVKNVPVKKFNESPSSDATTSTSTDTTATPGVTVVEGGSSDEEAQKLKAQESSVTSKAVMASATTSGTSTTQIPTLNSLSVSVQPFSGSASLPIAINLPSGRAGIQPSVALVYSSGLPESFTGVGWNLDMGSVQRSTKKGPPKYNSTDTFVLMQNGSSGNLVWDSTVSRYRSDIEGAFAKITSSGSGAAQTWLMTDKKGTKYFFGQSAASRQSDPADTAKIFEWALDRVEDISGNYMTITYLKHGNELYPSIIEYTGNSNTPTIAPFAKVVFNYTDVTRTLTSYKTAFLVSSSKLLDNVSVYANSVLLTKYKLNYQQSVSSRRYLLTSVVQYGANGTSPLPTVSFTYQGDIKGFNLEQNWSVPLDAFFVFSEAGGKKTDRGVRVADINGDAYPDLVRAFRACDDSYSVTQTFKNSKQSGFDQTTSWLVPTAAKGFMKMCASSDHSLGVQLTDVNSDMWVDVVRNYKRDPVYGNQFYINSMLNDKTGSFEETPAWLSPQDAAIIHQKGIASGTEYSEYQGVIYADVNGDSYTDIVISKAVDGGNHNVYINQAVNGGTGWLLDPVWTTPTDGYASFAGGATLADLNGEIGRAHV